MFCDPDPHAHTLQVTQVVFFFISLDFLIYQDDKDVVLPATF